MSRDAIYWNVVDRNTGEVFLRGVSVKEAEAARQQLPQQFKCVPSPDQDNPWELPDAKPMSDLEWLNQFKAEYRRRWPSAVANGYLDSIAETLAKASLSEGQG